MPQYTGQHGKTCMLKWILLLECAHLEQLQKITLIWVSEMLHQLAPDSIALSEFILQCGFEPNAVRIRDKFQLKRFPFVHLSIFLYTQHGNASGIDIISSITAANVNHPKPKTYSVCCSKHPSSWLWDLNRSNRFSLFSLLRAREFSIRWWFSIEVKVFGA